jgi:glutathione S-transferase
MAGQVPAVDSTMAARWRSPTPSSAISPAAATSFRAMPFAAAKMDEWLFWEQYSHEPYIAVCRFQMFYLGNRLRPRSRQGQARLCGAGADGAHSPPTRSWSASGLARDVSLLAYTRAGA